MTYGLGLLGMNLAIIFISFTVAVIFYVLDSIAHMKALKALGYDKAWMAWIPLVQYYACADAVSDGQETINMFGKFNVPEWLFKFWWVMQILIAAIPMNDTLSTIIIRVLAVIFMGAVYSKMYAKLEHKTENETIKIGCVSGLLPIVAVVKFLMM